MSPSRFTITYEKTDHTLDHVEIDALGREGALILFHYKRYPDGYKKVIRVQRELIDIRELADIDETGNILS